MTTAESKEDIGTISPYVMKIIELGLPVCILANLLSAASTTTIMGEDTVYTDPSSEAFRRILEKKAPLVIEREIIPGNPDTKETFDLKDLLLDDAFLECSLRFRLDNTLLSNPDGFTDLLKDIEGWSEGVDVKGPVYEAQE